MTAARTCKPREILAVQVEGTPAEKPSTMNDGTTSETKMNAIGMERAKKVSYLGPRRDLA
jgi:hypothetical protein